jgi:hypothetical protein
LTTKRKVEWKDGDVWRQVKVKLGVSRNSNYTFEHLGNRYVFANLFEGTEVLVLQGNKWIHAGRINRYGEIFLGEGESYSEMIERQNKGKSTEQIIGELRGFMDPAPACPPLDKAEKTIASLKNQNGLEAYLFE